MTFNFLVFTTLLAEVVTDGVTTNITPIINNFNFPFKQVFPFMAAETLLYNGINQSLHC